MNAPERLWGQWSAQVRAFLPELHGHRSKTLAFFVLGVVLAGTTRLPRVAEALVGVSAAKTPSIERRLARFLANSQMAVVPPWTQLVGQLLRYWRDQRLTFVLDATSLDERATVLYLGLLVHSRLLPVSWHVLPVHEPWKDHEGPRRTTNGTWSPRCSIGSSHIWETRTARSSRIVAWSGIRSCSCARSGTGTRSSACPPTTPARPPHLPAGSRTLGIASAGLPRTGPAARELVVRPSSAVAAGSGLRATQRDLGARPEGALDRPLRPTWRAGADSQLCPADAR
jgi:hypothetical protein